MARKKKTATPAFDEDKYCLLLERWSEGQLPSPWAELMDYDATVCESGHLRYFARMGAENRAAIDGVCSVIPAALAENLNGAYEAFLALDLQNPTEKALRKAAKQGKLKPFDACYEEHADEVEQILEQYAKTLEN